MFKKQLKVIKHDLVNQTKLVLGIERRKNHSKRQFLESIFNGQTTKIPREDAMILITYTCIRMRDLWDACGSGEVYKVISESGYYSKKSNDSSTKETSESSERDISD